MGSTTSTNNNKSMSIPPAATSEPLSAMANRVINTAVATAHKNRSLFCGTEHLLHSLVTNAPDVGAFLAAAAANKRDGNSGKEAAEQLSALSLAFIKQTGATAAASPPPSRVTSLYSPSASRALQIAMAITQPGGAPAAAVTTTELQLLSGLLAVSEVDKRPTAAGNLIQQWLGGSSVSATAAAVAASNSSNTTNSQLLQALTQRLNIPPAQLAQSSLPPRDLSKFQIAEKVSVATKSARAANTFANSSDTTTSSNNFVGPVPDSHWIYQGKLLCGASPGRLSEAHLIKLVQDVGVNVFVCLQTSYREYGCNDYRASIKTLAESGKIQARGGRIEFIHAPIPDFGIVEDTAMLARVQEIVALINAGDSNGSGNNGNIVFLHCMGGHGRTGSVAVNLIAAVEGVPTTVAMASLRQKHRAGRPGCGGHCALGQGELEQEDQDLQRERMEAAMSKRQKYVNNN